MSDPSGVTEGGTADAEARVRAGYADLLSVLQEHEATGARALGIRGDLARAVAETGRHDEALYQVDELVKDAERTHGPEHRLTAAARAAQDDVRRAAGYPVE